MSGFLLKKVEIVGFRGFTKQQQLEFGNPLTLIYGANRNGKSSVLNAVEWCLFGPEVAAIKYGEIRERESWEVKNLNSSSCHVECIFQSREGEALTVKRTYRTARTSDFFFQTEAGLKSADEGKLHLLLQISSIDFVSSVHLHPEIVRSLIIAKPKERKEAIDRLLGMSELRDIVNAFATERPSSWTDALNQSLTVLDEKLTTALSEKKKIIDSESGELMAKGFHEADFTAAGALGYANRIMLDLLQFGTDYHLPKLNMEAPSDFAGVQKFRNELPSAIQRLRIEHPVLADQGKHLTRKNALESLRSSYIPQLTVVADAQKSLESYPEKRSDDQLNEAVAASNVEISKIDKEMREIAKNAEVLNNALVFFETRLDGEQLACPLCGETSRTVKAWRTHIQKEIEAKSLTPLSMRRQEFARTVAELEKSKKEKSSLQERITSERAKLATIVSKIEKGIEKAISSTDDPVAILNAEIRGLDDALASLQNQVATINARMDQFQQAVLDIDRFQRIGKAQQEIRKIEAIDENAGYKQVKKIRAECEQYSEDIEFLVEGLKRSVTEEAGQRLQAAQASISNTFRGLTNRADFTGLKVSPVGDGYLIELTNASGGTRSAVPILNHADINCAALSIFLALASSTQISHRLAFVILDDPSQSLDSICKQNLCTVLTGLCDSRQVIIATADDGLGSEVRRMTKNKLSYVMKDWSPVGGPTIEIEANAPIDHAV